MIQYQNIKLQYSKISILVTYNLTAQICSYDLNWSSFTTINNQY